MAPDGQQPPQVFQPTMASDAQQPPQGFQPMAPDGQQPPQVFQPMAPNVMAPDSQQPPQAVQPVAPEGQQPPQAVQPMAPDGQQPPQAASVGQQQSPPSQPTQELMTRNCSFCLQELLTGDVEALECGHVFHSACIARDMEVTGKPLRETCVYRCHRSTGASSGLADMLDTLVEAEPAAAEGGGAAAVAAAAAVDDEQGRQAGRMID